MKKFHLTLHKKLSKSETLNNNFENLKTTSFGRWFFIFNVWLLLKDKHIDYWPILIEYKGYKDKFQRILSKDYKAFLVR